MRGKFIWALIGFLLGALVVYYMGPRRAPSPGPFPAAPGPYRAQVTDSVGITFDDTLGVLRYSQDPIQVSRGDTIGWTYPDGDWIVDLGIGGPTHEVMIRGGSGELVAAIVRLDAPPDTYKYSVAVTRGDSLVTDDPKIIVKED